MRFEAVTAASWFETAQVRLLTMRGSAQPVAPPQKKRPQALLLAAGSLVVNLISALRKQRAGATSWPALTPAIQLLVAGLQDADEIRHAGAIPIFDRDRSLCIARGLAPWPNPQEEISDVFHGVLRSRPWRGRKRPAGVTPQTLSRNCRLGSGSIAVHFAFMGSIGHMVEAIALK